MAALGITVHGVARAGVHSTAANARYLQAKRNRLARGVGVQHAQVRQTQGREAGDEGLVGGAGLGGILLLHVLNVVRGRDPDADATGAHLGDDGLRDLDHEAPWQASAKVDAAPRDLRFAGTPLTRRGHHGC
jgi:hypothetical protein